MLKTGSETLKESSRLVMAIKALINVSISVSSKFSAAFSYQSKSKAIDLGKTGSQISDKLVNGIPGQRIDYLGLLAEWREFDICTDVAFIAIRDELAPDTVTGMDNYQIAMKQLAVRGETVVQALREAHEARSRYLLLVAQKQARESAIAEVKTIQEGHSLNSDLAQIQRGLHAYARGHLSIALQKQQLQKEDFAFLSPAPDSAALRDQWIKLSNVTVRDEQPQDYTLTFESTVFAIGWKNLLVKDQEVPFQLPPTDPRLRKQHRLRIQKIKVVFSGLASKQGSTKIGALEYTIALGPRLLDRTSPRKTSSSEEATIVQYYMPAIELQKQGDKNELQNPLNNFAPQSLCCGGKIFFDREYIDLSTVEDIQLLVDYNCLTFQRR